MRVLFVSSEVLPLAKTGGLADVSRALPVALNRHGIDIRILMPGYREAKRRIVCPKPRDPIAPVFGVCDGAIISGRLPDTRLPVWLVDAPSLFGREGGLYQDADGRDWPDNALRFSYFAKIAAMAATGDLGRSWRPDVVHANDWHAGLLPLWLSQAPEPRARSVFTTHNMAFQGNFPPAEVPDIIEAAARSIEFHGRLSCLKAGLRFADRVTTVSPTYAAEILTPEFGCGLDGVLRERGRDFVGILNGIDDEIWNPATDPALPANYSARNVSGKRTCKRALQAVLGLEVSAFTPLIAFASRFTHQKMADTLFDLVPWIIENGAQLVILGEGDREVEARLMQAQQGRAGKLSVVVGYDEMLAHCVHAGSDILLAPARFEPCGLVQLYALRYGTLPVVRRTGGLADTVVDATRRTIENRTATGFVFEQADCADLIAALRRALSLFHEPLQWRLVQLQAMTRDFSWNASAAEYMALYAELAAEAASGRTPHAEAAPTWKQVAR